MEKCDYYNAIFKRKSFHLFRNVGSEKLSPAELEDTEKAYLSFKPLYPGIRTAIRIVPAEKVNVGRNAEYCILIYSEKKENYLMNAGYLGEQLDLFLVSHNIGSLWFGIGKPDMQIFDGLEFVIMIAVHKVSDEKMFRKDMFKSKRKPIDEIWSGDALGVAGTARFSPSACNTQPWYVENINGKLTVYRYKKSGKRGIMPAAKVCFYNRIDIGIFLFILETCLMHEGYSFDAEFFPDNSSDETEKTKVAEYILK